MRVRTVVEGKEEDGPEGERDDGEVVEAHGSEASIVLKEEPGGVAHGGEDQGPHGVIQPGTKSISQEILGISEIMNE